MTQTSMTPLNNDTNRNDIVPTSGIRLRSVGGEREVSGDWFLHHYQILHRRISEHVHRQYGYRENSDRAVRMGHTVYRVHVCT